DSHRYTCRPLPLSAFADCLPAACSVGRGDIPAVAPALVNQKTQHSLALAAGWGMKGGRTLPSISPHKQNVRLPWRHAPAQGSIFDLGCLMSFAFAYIFSRKPTL